MPLSPAPTRWRDRLALSVHTLQTWPWLGTLRTLRQRFREDHLNLTASSLTFETLIALVPLMSVMLAVFSAFPMFATFQASLEKYFLQALVPNTIAEPVLTALNQFAQQAKQVGSVGLIAVVFTALAMMLTIDHALNAIWRVRQPRPFAQRVLVYWAGLTLGPLVIGVSISMTSYAISASRGFVSEMPGAVSLLLSLLEFGLVATAFGSLFHYVPNTHVRWRHALAGGAFVSAGLEVAKRLLAWYVASVPTYSTVYGAFATVPIFLLWIYIGWVVVLLGAVLAAYAPSLSMHVARRGAWPGDRFALALAVLRELAQAKAQQRGGATLAEVAESLRADPLLVDAVTGTLMAIDWVGRLEEAGGQRHVLLVDPAATRARPLLEALLLEPEAGTEAFRDKAGFATLTLGELL